MRKVLIIIAMAVLPTVSDAHCLWVLWETRSYEKKAEPEPDQGGAPADPKIRKEFRELFARGRAFSFYDTSPRDFFSTREQCQAGLKAAEAKAAKQPQEEGVTRSSLYECLPDTIDPRGPRRN